tara:strand:- start:103 stop:342 length:240 start_codon:yes stop_codon:yes gene_type:complete
VTFKSEKNKQTKISVNNTRHLKMPERLWKLVTKASKSNRTVNDYIISLIENDLIKRKMLKKSERKKFQSKNTRFRKRSN